MQDSSLKIIKLSGSLGRKFGVFHEMAVSSYPEAIRALSSQVAGFKEFMTSKVGSQSKFAVFVDGKNVGQYDSHKWNCAKEVRIIPVPSGSKSGGLLNVVIGAVMIAAAFWTGGASMAAWGALASSMAMTGGAMILGGVTQMLSPQPGGQKIANNEATANRPSYAFGAAVNTVASGYPIPLPYGERKIGGAIFSAGSYASDIV
jgi:predicted phage tail protein